jgi:hypothetical protein
MVAVGGIAIGNASSSDGAGTATAAQTAAPTQAITAGSAARAESANPIRRLT